MPKEKETFRLHMEAVRAAFPDREILSREDVKTYTGKKDFWLNSHGLKGSNLTRVKLANVLASLD